MTYPIYRLPPRDDPIDQGDIIEGCPLVFLTAFDADNLAAQEVESTPARVLVLTQTCDLANQKVSNVMCAVVLDAQRLVDQHMLKAADIRGPVRAGRVFGWYFLPRNTELGLPEMLVDLRQIHTVRLDLLTALCRRGQRRARVQPLYREHLARHFADTYSRIGLPEPYETE
jgi:hypothetical protein